MSYAVNACQGKTGYLTWDQANRSLKRGRFTDLLGSGAMNVYRCRVCQFWHVGRGALKVSKR